MGNGPLEQPLIYQVYYCTMVQKRMLITSLIHYHLLSHHYLLEYLVIIFILQKTAVNRFGSGTPSNVTTAEVCKWLVYLLYLH